MEYLTGLPVVMPSVAMLNVVAPISSMQTFDNYADHDSCLLLDANIAWCNLLHGAWCLLLAACCLLLVDCFMMPQLHGAWCLLHGGCCMVHGTFCMVHGACCMVHDACCLTHASICLHALHHTPQIHLYETAKIAGQAMV